MDMRGRYKRVRKKDVKKIGRPKGSRNSYEYDKEVLVGLPTEAKILSPMQIQILRGLMDPEIQKISSDAERCKKLGVSRSRYYTSLKDPTFLKIFNELSMSIIRAEAPALLRSSVKFAKEKSSAFQDRKMLYQMLGYLSPDGVDVNINVEQKQENPFEGLSLQELQALAKGYMNNDFVETEYKEVEDNGQS